MSWLRLSWALALGLLLSFSAFGADPLPATAIAKPAAAPVQVRVDTTLGAFTLELYPAQAPKSVANFLEYAKAGFYNGTIFHRVIPGFMAQGGGFDRQYQAKRTRPPIKNESNNGLYNERGSIAMARTNLPNSAESQFFINLADNGMLDYPGADGWGYAVFGKVIEGMETVDAMATVPTGHGRSPDMENDLPLKPIVIEKVTVLDGVTP